MNPASGHWRALTTDASRYLNQRAEAARFPLLPTGREGGFVQYQSGRQFIHVGQERTNASFSIFFDELTDGKMRRYVNTQPEEHISSLARALSATKEVEYENTIHHSGGGGDPSWSEPTGSFYVVIEGDRETQDCAERQLVSEILTLEFSGLSDCFSLLSSISTPLLQARPNRQIVVLDAFIKYCLQFPQDEIKAFITGQEYPNVHPYLFVRASLCQELSTTKATTKIEDILLQYWITKHSGGKWRADGKHSRWSGWSDSDNQYIRTIAENLVEPRARALAFTIIGAPDPNFNACMYLALSDTETTVTTATVYVRGVSHSLRRLGMLKLAQICNLECFTALKDHVLEALDDDVDYLYFIRSQNLTVSYKGIARSLFESNSGNAIPVLITALENLIRETLKLLPTFSKNDSTMEMGQRYYFMIDQVAKVLSVSRVRKALPVLLSLLQVKTHFYPDVIRSHYIANFGDIADVMQEYLRDLSYENVTAEQSGFSDVLNGVKFLATCVKELKKPESRINEMLIKLLNHPEWQIASEAAIGLLEARACDHSDRIAAVRAVDFYLKLKKIDSNYARRIYTQIRHAIFRRESAAANILMQDIYGTRGLCSRMKIALLIVYCRIMTKLAPR